MAIAIVQSWGGGSGKLSSYTSPLSASDITAGNWLVYFVLSSFGTASLTSAGEANGNGISTTTGQVSSSPVLDTGSAPYYAWAVPITTGGAKSSLAVTTGLGGGSYFTISGVELSGVGGIVTNAGVFDSTFPTSHPGVTLTGLPVGAAVITGFCDYTSSTLETYTAGSGFTILSAATFLGSANTYDPAGVEYNLSPSASQACPWTSSVATQSGTIAIALSASVPAVTQALMFHRRNVLYYI